METLNTSILTSFKNTCPDAPISISNEISKMWYSKFWNDVHDSFTMLDEEKRSFHKVWNSACNRGENLVGRSMIEEVYSSTKTPSKNVLDKVCKKYWYIKVSDGLGLGVKYANMIAGSNEPDKEKIAFVELIEKTMNKFRGNVGEQLIEFFSKKNLFSCWYSNYSPLVSNIYEKYIDAKAETNGGTPIGIQIKNYSFKGVKLETFSLLWTRITTDVEFKCDSINEFKKHQHGIVISINSSGYLGKDTQKNINEMFGNAIELIDVDKIEPVLTPNNQNKLEMYEELVKIFE